MTRNNIKAIGFFVCALLLSGCAQENMKPDQSTAPIPSLSTQSSAVTDSGSSLAISQKPEKSTAPATTNNGILENTPRHIKQTLGENVTIDADVFVPLVDAAPVLNMAPIAFDEKALTAKFFPSETPGRQVDNDDTTQVITYRGDKAVLVLTPGSLEYNSVSADIYNLPLFDIDFTLMGGAENVYGDVYKKDHLDGIDKSKSIADVKEFLQSLGMSLYGEPTVYSLDYETMQNWQDHILKTQDLSAEIKNKKIAVKQTLTKEDEAYLMNFQATMENLPVTQTSYELQSTDRTMNGCEITVLYTNNGVIQCSIFGAYKKEGISNTPKSLLTVDQAISKLRERWNSIISSTRFNITHIALEYVPIPKANDMLAVSYTPCWVFTINSTGQVTQRGKTVTYRNDIYMHVNAATGDILD